MKDFLRKVVVWILTWESKQILKKYHPKIIAVTGSVGKTSTKDAIAKVLEQKYKIRKSEKSYNSELGVPLTVIGSQSGWGSFLKWIGVVWKGFGLIVNTVPYPEILVLEVGADRPGDIKKIRELITPDTAVLTSLAETPVHVEFFESPEEIFEEKGELVKGLPETSNVFLNFDDEEIVKFRENTAAKIFTYGLSDGSEFLGFDYGIFYQKEENGSIPEGISFKVNFSGQEFSVKVINAFGRHHVYPALAAIAVGLAYDIEIEKSVEALSLYSPPPGRLKLIRGINGSIILDDSYNSSPKALAAALDVLEELNAKRKIAVLGDMLELGRHTITAHRDLGRQASKVADILCTVGVRAKFFIEGAMKDGFKKKTIYTFGTSEDAAKELPNIVREGDLVLVKGSQSIRMEKIVEALMADPARKKELLCRQDEEWKKI